jgi:hypothetical protein
MNSKTNDKVVIGTLNSDASAGTVLKHISDVQKRALDIAPSDQVGVLQITYIIACVGICIGSGLILKDHEQIGGTIIVMAFLCMAAGMYFLRPQQQRHASERRNAPATGGGAIAWSRVTLRKVHLEGRQQISKRLEGLLNNARTTYALLLATRNSPITADIANVRINVFLPDTHDGDLGEVCGLKIAPEFQHGMLDEKERGVRFRPNEGLTGRVFTYSKAFGARRDSAEDGWIPVAFDGGRIDGGDRFNMSEDQINQINSAIRWIVSFPLTGSFMGEPQTYGVLNVDGLNESVTALEMAKLYQSLLPQVELLATDFFKFEKNRITISVSEVNDV